MSKKNLSYLVIVALLFILNLIMAGDGGKVLIGEPVTAGSAMPISDINNFPNLYTSKLIRVEGRISEIYRNSRCSFLMSDDQGCQISIQCSGCGYQLQKDDVGRKCIVEGFITKIGNSSLGKISDAEYNVQLVTDSNEQFLYCLDSRGIILE